MGDLHNCGELHTSDEPSQADGEARSVTNPEVAEHLEELTPIKPNVSLLCKECTYKTNYLPAEEDGKKENAQSPAQEPPQGS